jgi:Fur family ferric uptake transcriptional regulator
MDHSKEILKSHSLKVTPTRVMVLEILSKAKKPLSVKDIQKKLGQAIDLATLYRTFETLRFSGLVLEVDFKHGHSHYELATMKHHHHAICEKCGRVVDISKCDIKNLEKQVLKLSKFKKINSHSLEFFGICNQH